MTRTPKHHHRGTRLASTSAGVAASAHVTAAADVTDSIDVAAPIMHFISSEMVDLIEPL
jgi:hypothetical protein